MGQRLGLKILFLLLIICGSTSQASEVIFQYYNFQKSPRSEWNKPHARPVLVWIHGCRQSPEDFVEYTDILEKTEASKPIIIAPHPSNKINVFKCWNFLSKEMRSRHGDFMEIVNEVQDLINKGHADPERIYIGGFSSGAILANHIALCYPDIFKGALIHSGTAFNTRNSMNPNSARNRVVEAIGCSLPSNIFRLQNLIYIHGAKDKVVRTTLGASAYAQAIEYFDFWDDGQLNYSYILKGDDSLGIQSAQFAKDLRAVYLNIPNMGHRWSGSKAGSAFSSPDTLNAVDLFLTLIDDLK